MSVLYSNQRYNVLKGTALYSTLIMTDKESLDQPCMDAQVDLGLHYLHKLVEALISSTT